MSVSIETVVSAGLCAGCGACASDLVQRPVKMTLVKSGFLRPEGVPKPFEDGRLRNVCPALTLKLVRDPSSEMHAHWGPLVSLRAGWSTDPEVRYRGSSGGIISALLIHLLDSHQVDFVAHVGVSSENPLHNHRRISRSRAEVLANAGSRYAPAAPLAEIQTLFSSGERFAFVGKPCDAAALRQYLQEFPQRRNQVVAVISFMCAGVPSLKGTHEILAALGTLPKDVVRFQYRGNGWPGYTTAELANGQTRSMDYNRSWGQILGKHLQLRCKLCPDGTGEFADVVGGDAWFGNGGYPDFTERDGRSLLLARTSGGEALILSALQAGALIADQMAVSDLRSIQPYQFIRKQVVLGRWLGVWLRTGIWPKFKGLGLLAALCAGGLLPVFRNAWGTFRRVRTHGD